MSTEDIKSVAEVLNNILQPDNNIRKEAEKKLRKEGYPYLIYRKKQGNCKSSLTYWTPLRSLNATDLS